MLKKLVVWLVLLFTSIGISTQAQKKETQVWDVANPEEPFKELEFTTQEGTWMNLDVSPDGKTIVFDLLGDIYSIPVTGGDARLLRGGYPFEVQPRFSPDGKKISFTSDAGGGDNVWVMDVDGSNARQITKENLRLLNNAVWTPDGNYLIARKHFTSQRSMGAGEMWMYHVSGGAGIQLTKRKNDQQDAGEPCVSPDGKYLYFSEDMYPGGHFQYNKDPNSQIYVIRRLDLTSGEFKNIITGAGGAVRPQLSRDGKKLAFVRRVRTKSVLFIYDLETGEQKPVYDQLNKDQQEAWAIFGVYPNYNWLPDNKNLVIWAGGKFQKLNTETGQAVVIPFTAKSKHKITDAVKFEQKVAPEKFTAKVIRHAKTSPDGKTLVFSAVGHLWTKSLPNGKPKRLTKGTDFEFEPAFSPDGKTIVYVTWNDEEKGAMHKISVKGGNSTRLTKEKGIFRTPAFSPDGQKIVYQKEGGNIYMGQAHAVKPGIYWIANTGGKPNFICSQGANPVFDKEGKRIFYNTGGYLFGALDKKLESVNLEGAGKKTHFTSKYANQYAISPDNQWIAFGELHQVYVAPFPKIGQKIELTANTQAFPVSKVSRDAGINLHWSPDSKKLCWTLGEEYFSNALTERFTFLQGATDSVPPVDTVGLKVGLELKTDMPKGVVVFKGGRVITMKGEEVLENGIIVVEGNKIKAVGKEGEVPIPARARVIDATGKTIMPGLIDTHAHLGTFRHGLSPQKQWSYYANLAYGVTATHDPSSNSEMVFSQSEMVKAGTMTGPRVYSTGTILYGAEGDFKAVIDNLEDARSALRRTSSYGAFSVKSYNQPRRSQRQQVIKAAREQKMMVYPEGGSTFFHNLSMILDGHTSIEHNIPVAPVYKDVLELWSASKTANTPTLIVCYGAVNGEYYWYQKTNVWEKSRLLKYIPRSIIDSRARHRTMIPDEEYENGHILVSKSLKKLADKGVKICVGGHGQLQGLGVHWEIWMLAQGGMSTMQCLKAATLHGAEYLGMDKELGSLEEGKVADLIVLDKNPLENIQNTEFVRYTMVNGRLYDAETLNEVGNYDKPRSKFFWEVENYSENFEWHQHTHSFEKIKCVCGH